MVGVTSQEIRLHEDHESDMGGKKKSAKARMEKLTPD
jgi:hypothetical protein